MPRLCVTIFVALDQNSAWRDLTPHRTCETLAQVSCRMSGNKDREYSEDFGMCSKSSVVLVRVGCLS